MDGGNALHITYYTATRDETTERVVDPMRVLIVDGRAYLEAWCRRAEAVRLFRVDRIDGFIELDEPAVLPRQAQHSDLRDGVFRASPDLPLVTLRIGRGARWITEYYPCEEVIDTDSECWLVRMRVSDLAWARRLVLGLGESRGGGRAAGARRGRTRRGKRDTRHRTGWNSSCGDGSP